MTEDEMRTRLAALELQRSQIDAEITTCLEALGHTVPKTNNFLPGGFFLQGLITSNVNFGGVAPEVRPARARPKLTLLDGGLNDS